MAGVCEFGKKSTQVSIKFAFIQKKQQLLS